MKGDIANRCRCRVYRTDVIIAPQRVQQINFVVAYAGPVVAQDAAGTDAVRVLGPNKGIRNPLAA